MDTIRRWIVTVLGAAGINTNVFKAHNTRADATSKAASKNVPIETILAAGMWNRENTFTINRDIIDSDTSHCPHFQTAVLSKK